MFTVSTNDRFAVTLSTNIAVDVLLPVIAADVADDNAAPSPSHLENTKGAVPVAVIDIGSPEDTGITVFDVIVYTAPSIVTTTEPVPVMFTVCVRPPVTKYAVAVRLPGAVVDTLLPSECRSPVALTHLENVYPEVPAAAMDIVSPEAMGITVLTAILYAAPFIVTATEPDPLMFAFSVKPPVTKYAVAVRLPDTVVDTPLLSECRSPVALTHLENTLPVAVMEMKSSEATGIGVLTVIVYAAPFISKFTEPVPLMFAFSVKPPVTKTAVAVRLLDTEAADTVLLSECKDAVSLTHLENTLPAAVIDIESPEAMGIVVSALTV